MSHVRIDARLRNGGTARWWPGKSEAGGPASSVFPPAIRIGVSMDRCEIGRVAEEVPLFTLDLSCRGNLVRSTEVVGQIGQAPRQPTGYQRDHVDRPA